MIHLNKNSVFTAIYNLGRKPGGTILLFTIMQLINNFSKGVMMGTRCGDLDPGIIPSVASALNIPPDEVVKMLNHESGFLGIAGTSDSRSVSF